MNKILLPLLLLLSFESIAQKKKNVITESLQLSDSAYYSKLNYRLIGPWRGGRSAAVAGSYQNKNTFFFGATGGGVWKTTDGGSNWKNITDKYFGGSIGAVAVAPSDESVMYVGEGENTMRGNVAEGFGMWRSQDGGRSWKHIGLKETRHIIRIIVHPRNPDILWVAAMGHLFGPNTERGIYKTTDAGKTWKRVLFVNEQTGCSDLVMEPGNPEVMYAGMWRVIRTPYSMESGGEGSGLYKSTDGGETWNNISSTKGLPKGIWGIVGVAIAPSNPEKIYTLIENANGGLFTSNDGGTTWALTSTDNNIRQRAWYFSKLFVDPKNENLLHVLNVQYMRSTDGGKSFKSVPTPHGDHHDMWIDPADGNRMIMADDGGGQVSFDGGNNWSTYMNQPTAQVYRVSTDNSFPYRVLAAQQDNSTFRIRSRTYGNGITQNDWQVTAGAESGYVVADPANPEIVYGGNYGGFISRFDHKTGENRTISVWPDAPIGSGADALKYRFQWNFPLFFSPHNPKRFYAAGNHLFYTEDEGLSWTNISPDLTTNDKSKQTPSGGPITKDNTSVEYYCTIFTAAESHLEKDLLWTGSDDGLIHITRDGGKNWKNVTPASAPKWMMWNSVEIDPYKKGAAYFVGTRYKSDDFTPYIYKTEDYGASWKVLTNGIDKLHFTRCLRADKVKQGLLYAGTEYGMYISYDDGANWKPFQLKLPVVSITDLAIKENDLIVGTQGRSVYILDDLSLVQQKADQNTKKPFHLFNINPAFRMSGSVNANAQNAGLNPPNAVVINYWLKDITDSTKVSFIIIDKLGKMVKTFNKDSKDSLSRPVFVQGMNQFLWNMEYPAGEKIDGMILWNGVPASVKAAPGNYFARLKVDNDSIQVPFVIKGDPNYKMSEQDFELQVNFLLEVQQKFNEIQNTIKDIRSLRTQLNDLGNNKLTADHKDIKLMADSIQKKITAIEEKLYQTKAKSGQDVLNYPIRLNDQISNLFNYANSGYTVPARQVKDAYLELSAKANEQINAFKKILGTDVKLLNEKIHEKKVQVIGVKTAL